MRNYEKIIRMIMKTKRKDARHLVIIPPAQLENILVALTNNQKSLDERLSTLFILCDWAAKSISIWVVLMLVAVLWTLT